MLTDSQESQEMYLSVREIPLVLQPTKGQEKKNETEQDEGGKKNNESALHRSRG